MTQITDWIPESLPILGIGLHVFESYEHAVRIIQRRVSSDQRTFCVAINPEKIYRAKHDTKLLDIIDSAHLRICDGVGISLASRMLHGRSIPRCTGIDLFLNILGLAAAEKWGVFLLGATAESNRTACAALERTYPGLIIAGSHAGYFIENAGLVDEINSSGAKLLFVALGSPRQEYWISENMRRLQARFVMGIGGSLDVISGSATRAPKLIRRFGAEWLFRLLAQPARAGRQRALPLFAFEVMRSAMLHGRSHV